MKTTFNKTTVSKTLFTLIAWVSGSFCLQAQSACTVGIPPLHIRISNDQTINPSMTPYYWVCEGVNLTVASTSQIGMVQFFLEKDATINFLALDNYAVYAKDSSVVTNNSGSLVLVTCNSAAVTLNNNNGSGGIMVFTSCLTSVIFDYSQVGGGPCVGTTTSTNDYSGIIPISLYPNPSSGKFTIQTSNVQYPISNIEIYNTLGEKVYEESPRPKESKEINITLPSGLGQGVYFLQIKTEQGTINQKLIISK